MQQEALKVAFDFFKVPEEEQRGLKLKCRPKGSPKGTPWMHIQREVWTDIVEDMDFLLSGFKTDLRP